ncbi:aspartyl-phosphate phosphatase Spo0E family protein [Cytobacillus sp. FJAT-53684]|uniref:Aspartyl-phosphate phosphatase Spo0E family protein n=1 Tax=Cytobacillus mangrovibacter TaxID=3299024 RepID=A0ABW6K1I4_9BACI
MGEQGQKILIQIQEKRERMIDSAKEHGYTSDSTIRCSEELDQLIYEYQRERQKDKKQKKKVHFSCKHIFMNWHHKKMEVKYYVHS